MISHDIIKVYAIYLINQTESYDKLRLYAYTTEKDIKDAFLKQRCKDSFIVKKIKMDDIEYSVFANQYQLKKLSEYPVEISFDQHIMMYMTDDEMNTISWMFDGIEHEMDEIKREFMKLPLKNKYKKAIKYFTNRGYHKEVDGKIEERSRANTLFAMMELFEGTFDKNGSTYELPF